MTKGRLQCERSLVDMDRNVSQFDERQRSMARDTGPAVCSQSTSPTTISTAHSLMTPPIRTEGKKSGNDEGENDSLSIMMPSQPLHDKLDELEQRWSAQVPTAEKSEHMRGRIFHRPSRSHSAPLSSPSSIVSEQQMPTRKKSVEIIGTPDEFPGRQERPSVFDRLYQQGKAKTASRQQSAGRGGRTFHSLPSPRTLQSSSIEGTVSTLSSSGSVFDRLYKNEKRSRSNVYRINGFRNLSNGDAYPANSASTAASLERRLAYASPPARRRNRVNDPGKVVSSPQSRHKSVDDRTVASSTDSVFERLYRREKRKIPVKVDESTVRVRKIKRDRAKALPSDSSPSPLQPQKGTLASSDSVFERLYRREKRQIPLSLDKSRIHDRTPSMGSEAASKRDSEKIRKQSVLETSPSPTVETGRAEQSLVEESLFVAEDSSYGELPTPTALRYVNFSFDEKDEPVSSSKHAGNSGAFAAPGGGVILYASQDQQNRVVRDVLARLKLHIYVRRIQCCARAYITRMSRRAEYESEFMATASPTVCSLRTYKGKGQVPDISTVELKYQEQYLTPTSHQRRSAITLQKVWRCHRSQIQAAYALLNSWRLECELNSGITDNRILAMKVRVHSLAKAIGRVDCWWITENVRLEDGLVHVKWEREVGVHFTDRGVPKLESCIVRLKCKANLSAFTEKWGRRKLAILIVKAALERRLIRDRAGLVNASATLIQTWIRMKEPRIAFVRKVNACRNIQRFFRGTCRCTLNQGKDAAEQIEARTTGDLSLNDERDKLVDPVFCHDESEEYAATAIQSHVRRFLIIRRVRSCDRASRSIQCLLLVRRQRTLHCTQSQNAAVALIQASMRSFHQRLKIDRNEKSAIKVQSTWRAIATRDSFVELRTSAIVIQAWERRRQCLTLSCTLREAKVCELKTSAASLIQRLCRGARARDRLANQRKSATRIQCVYRRHANTRSLHTLYVGVVALQAAHRGIMARRLILLWHTLVARARLALLVQTIWRGSRKRDQYALFRTSTTVIQSAYRKHFALRSFRTLSVGTVALQIVYRRIRNSRVNVRSVAAVKVQKVWRGSRSRVKVASLREKLQSERIAKEGSAAGVIQSWYRCWELRGDFLALLKAAMVIQTFERRRNCQSRYTKQYFAAVRVQAAWRGDRTRHLLSLVRENAQKQQKQAMVAGVVALQHVARVWLERKVAAIVLIQSFYRKHCLRKNFLSAKQIATRIQTAERRRQCTAKYVRVLRGTMLLQARHRGFLTRQVLLRRADTEEAAAAVVQTCYRGFSVRQYILTLQQIAIRIQAAERRRQSLSDYRLVLCGTVRLQALRRGYLTRRISANRPEMEEAAAVVIQTYYRGFFLCQNFLTLQQFVVRIQAAERRRQSLSTYILVLCGTVRLQALRRGLLIRRMLARRAETEKAAVVIQRLCRSVFLRQNFLTLKQASIRIQAEECRRQCVAKYARFLSGISRVQAQHRAFMARRAKLRRAEMEKAKEAGAFVIQTFFRGLLVRQHFLTLRQIAVRIQAAERCRQYRAKYSLIVRGTIRLQAHHRGYLARRMLVKRVDTENAAAAVIQVCYRGFSLCQNFLALKQAAIRIQAAVRRRQSRSTYILVLCGTVRLQALRRGCLTRRMLGRRIETEHAGAVVIQTFYRGLVLRLHFLTLKQIAIRDQAAERCRQHTAMYIRVSRGTIRLQAHHRGVLARRMLARRVDTENTAAVVIQRFYRSLFFRQNFLTLKHAFIRIQAVERRRRSLSNYGLVLCGTVRLQALHGGFLTRRMLARRAETEEASAVVIQTYYKNFASRQVLLMRRQAVVRIQTLERRRLSLSKYAIIVVGIVRLQAQYRGFLIRRLLTELAAAVIIQSRFRGFVSRGKFLTCRVVVVRVQAMTRRRYWLSQYSSITRGIVRLQALYRGFSVRRWLILYARAARVIQVRWRAALQSRRFQASSKLLSSNKQPTLPVTTPVVSADEGQIVDSPHQSDLQMGRDPIHSAAVAIRARHNRKLEASARLIQVAYFTWKMQVALLMVQSSVVLLQRSVRGQLLRSAARFALSHINVSFRSTILVSFARITSHLDPGVVSINHAWSKAVVLAIDAACIIMQSAARRMLAIRYSVELRKRLGLPAFRQFVNRNAASAFMSIKSISSSVSYTGRRGKQEATKNPRRQLSTTSAMGVQPASEKPADVMSEAERQLTRHCSARVIQRTFRSHSKRRSMRVHHVAAFQLQNWHRQRLGIARYAICKAGIICLQSQFHGACVRSEVTVMTSAIVHLQQLWRMHRERVRYCIVRDATLLIQANYRMRVASRAFDIHRKAVVVIQTVYRSWHGRKTYFDQRIYRGQLRVRIEKSIKSQASESSRKEVNRLLDGSPASAGICIGRLAHRFLSVAEKSKSMKVIASAEKQEYCRLSENTFCLRNETDTVNAGAADVATDEWFEEVVRCAVAAKDATTNGWETQLSTASKAKAPPVLLAASSMAVIDEPKEQVGRETETRERPPSPSTLQLAMEAQQLLREARHARISFQKTRGPGTKPKKRTILTANERTHHSVPPSKSTNPVVDQQLFGKTEGVLPSPIKPEDDAWDWTKGGT